MVLTTHAIVGAAVASSLPVSPAFAVALAFGSHFFLDALPHWDYSLRSLAEDEGDHLKTDFVLNRRSLADLLKIGADFLLGLALAWFFFQSAGEPLQPIIFLGALAGMLPDFFQFAYFKLRVEPFRSLQRFHHWVHTSYKIKSRPVLGIALQVLLCLAVVAIVYYS